MSASDHLSKRLFEGVAEKVRTPGEGATVNVRTGDEVHSGWAVARPDAEHTAPAKDATSQSIADYANTKRRAVESAGHVGLWHDPDDGTLYHDATEVHPNTFGGGVRAIADGYKNRQISVYNMDRGNTVYMRPKTRSQKNDTRKGMAALKRQNPQEHERISNLPTDELRRRFENRVTLSEGRPRS